MNRKHVFPVLLCCLALAAASCGGSAPETTAGAGGSGGFRLRDGETFVFAGDSITDCGRRRGPLRGRRATMNLLGDGYVSQVADLVRARYPEHTIKFINEGISGDTVVDLEERWDAVLAHKPDWLSVLVGINDLGSVLGKYGNVTPEIYEKKYRALLARAKKHCNPKLILIDPFYLSTAHGTKAPEGVVSGASEKAPARRFLQRARPPQRERAHGYRARGAQGARLVRPRRAILPPFYY